MEAGRGSAGLARFAVTSYGLPSQLGCAINCADLSDPIHSDSLLLFHRQRDGLWLPVR